MAAAGKVCTGFSRPWVAKYSANGGTVTYSGAMQLARGVEVKIDPETAADNTFYADNMAAESQEGVLTGGTTTLTVDGLFRKAEDLIMGLPETKSEITINGSTKVSVTDYDDDMKIPYIGLGFVVRYMSDGVTSYSPVVLTKLRTTASSEEYATQEEEIDWQTKELEMSIHRDDSTKHRWKRVADDQESEDAAEACIKAMLNYTEPGG